MLGGGAVGIQFKWKVLKMRLPKSSVICVLGLLMMVGAVQARRLGRHRRGPQNFVPVYRAMDDQYTMPTTAEQETESERQVEPVQPSPISNTKFLLLKTAASAAAATASKENINAGRTFKHLLLYKNLLRPEKEYYGGGGGGYMMPYIIINNPTNLTNVNNNTLSNAAAAAPTATTTGTGTATGTGTRMGGVGGVGANFASYFSRPPQQALPMAVPMPTQIYQQRETNGAQTLPYNLVALMGMNGLSGLMPVALPGSPPPNMNQRRRAPPQRRRAPPATPQRNRNNPFTAFANSFRGMQFF